MLQVSEGLSEHGLDSGLTGSDVLVEPEEVGRVVGVLEGHQAGVLGVAVGVAHAVGLVREVEVGGTAAERRRPARSGR